MGRPKFYSAEVPIRCQALITALSHQIEEDAELAKAWGGPLKTTFLLAMATPMIVLPFERVYKARRPRGAGVANDFEVDRSFSAEVVRELGPERHFVDTPFFVPDSWSLVPSYRRFQVGGNWPPELLRKLGEDEAFETAKVIQSGKLLSILRNALAHGGVAYLDRSGAQTEQATHMLGFASFTTLSDRDHIDVLRISVQNFEAFLHRWAAWLEAAQATLWFEERGPGHFDHLVA